MTLSVPCKHVISCELANVCMVISQNIGYVMLNILSDILIMLIDFDMEITSITFVIE